MPITLADPPTFPASRDIYLPIVATPPVNQVAAFYRLLVADQRQQRGRLEVCACLEQAAMWRSHGLANGDPWSHVDRHGIRPNAYARRAGCVLPQDYALDGNNIESLVAGSADPAVMFAALAASPSHANHLFGLSDFFRKQDKIGVAVCESPDPQSMFRWYWAIFICRCE